MIQVSTRLWLGGAISPPRDTGWIRTLVTQIWACALCRPLLIYVDGLSRYVGAIRAVFREPMLTGRRGRSWWRPWDGVCIAQIIKQVESRRVTPTTRRLLRRACRQGALAAHEGRWLDQHRLYRTAEGHLPRPLGRLRPRMCALARQTATLEASMDLLGTVYNFCTEHDRLRLDGLLGGHKWSPHTSAMAAGLTDYRWSVHDTLQPSARSRLASAN